MRIQDFQAHHGLIVDPFSQEDAKEDTVFKERCVDRSRHPHWEKICGKPEEPSAAVVLGERGSGKTALRFQIVEHLRSFNQSKPEKRVLILEYEEFNPFLDEFSRHGVDLSAWELRDHMDAILSLGVRKLIKAILRDDVDESETIREDQLSRLSAPERRDLLLLAAAYDRSDQSTGRTRWQSLRQAIRFPGLLRRLMAKIEMAIGAVGTLLVVLAGIEFREQIPSGGWIALLGLPLLLFWAPYFGRWHWAKRVAAEIASHVRVVHHDDAEIRHLLLKLRRSDLQNQPLLKMDDSDARYSLLNKLVAICKKLDFAGIVVIVDRVDEPTLVNGDPEKMFQLVRPILDRKFLKVNRVGIKLLLPAEISPLIRKNIDENIARLDKQNYIPTLEWTGSSLRDLINSRLQACRTDSQGSMTIRNLLDDAIADTEIEAYLDKLKTPRNAFKFMTGLIVKHCQSHPDERVNWKVSRDAFIEFKTEFMKDVEAFRQGLVPV